MLVLASASPRRQDLLRNAGLSFTVQAADIDETPLPGEDPVACAERLAREKALAVWDTRQEDLVLGADTIVVVNGAMLAKPVDDADASRMLHLLSGRTHQVITGICLAGPPEGKPNPDRGALRTENWEPRTACESTLVTFIELSDDDIRDYVATGEPMDKAGAYAIQGGAVHFVRSICGSYSNVVGLPMAELYELLQAIQNQA